MKKYGARELWRWRKTRVQNTAFHQAKQTSYIFSLKYAIFCLCASHSLHLESISPGSAASLHLFHPGRWNSGTPSPYPVFLSNPPEALFCFCSPPRAPSRLFLEIDHFLHTIIFMYLLILFFLPEYSVPEGRIFVWSTPGLPKQTTQGLDTWSSHSASEWMNK